MSSMSDLVLLTADDEDGPMLHALQLYQSPLGATLEQLRLETVGDGCYWIKGGAGKHSVRAINRSEVAMYQRLA